MVENMNSQMEGWFNRTKIPGYDSSPQSLTPPSTVAIWIYFLARTSLYNSGPPESPLQEPESLVVLLTKLIMFFCKKNV